MKNCVLASIIVAGAGLAQWGNAATVDLSTTTGGAINGGLFQRFDQQSTGTGVINSFLRLQANGTEQGYNTSGRPVPFDELNDPSTHNLTLGQLPILNVSGTDYYSFLLDTNEPNGGGQDLVTLDELQFYTSATGSQTTTTVGSLGTLRYDLGTGNSVIVDDNFSHGSGQGDARILIPTSAFGAALATDFVYLVAHFSNASGGFEEFAIQASASAIPLPSVAGLGAAGLVGFAGVRRRRV